MKKLLLLVLISLPVIASAQSEINSKPFKKANRIVIDSTGAKDSTFNMVLALLVDNGYMLDMKDKEAGIVTTLENTPRKTAAVVKIMASVKDGQVIFSGQFKPALSMSLGGVRMESNFERIYYGGMKGSIIRDAWDELNRVANELKIGVVNYAVK